MNIPSPNFLLVRKFDIGSRELVSKGVPWSKCDWTSEEGHDFEIYDGFVFACDPPIYPFFENPIDVHGEDRIALDVVYTGHFQQLSDKNKPFVLEAKVIVEED